MSDVPSSPLAEVILSDHALGTTVGGITRTYGAWVSIDSLDEEYSALRLAMDQMIEVLQKVGGRLEEAKFITRPPGIIDDDPLPQRGFVAWKMGYKIKGESNDG